MQIEFKKQYEKNGYDNYAVNKIFNPNEKIAIVSK